MKFLENGSRPQPPTSPPLSPHLYTFLTIHIHTHTYIHTYIHSHVRAQKHTQVVGGRIRLMASHIHPFPCTCTHTYTHTQVVGGRIRLNAATLLQHTATHCNTPQVVGGRIRLMASGAAPLSPDLHKFLTQVFGCPVLQGYGMTENCAAAVVQPLGYRLGGAWAS